MTCPGCNSHTSSVLAAVRVGDPCPYCGLSADAIEAVGAARERHGEKELVDQLQGALVRADKAEQEARKLRSVLSRVQAALREAGDLP